MKKLYMCNTPYHIFCTLVKEIRLDNSVDIILSDKTLGYENLLQSLKLSDIVDKVFLFEESKFHLPKINPNKYGNITQNRKVRNVVKPYITFDTSIYDEIYMYHDFTRFGCYIIASSIKYNLIEDGLDYFKVFDKFIDIDLSFRRRLLSLFNLNILHYGQSKYCKSIEVNDINGIRIPKKKVKEVPRNEMIKRLTEEEKKKIYDIFMPDIKINSSNKERILLLTEPLFKDGRISSEEEQIKLYSDIISKYTNKEDQLYIKPHPRDMTDYSKLKNEFTLIDQQFPVEILNFNKEVHFSKAITITSASIDGINFIHTKIKLGFDFLEKYKKEQCKRK